MAKEKQVDINRFLCRENVWTEKQVGKLVCHFKFATEMVGADVKEFINGADRPAFPNRKLMDTGKSEFMIIQVDQCPFIRYHYFLISIHTCCLFFLFLLLFLPLI